jgi:hypothetical protein
MDIRVVFSFSIQERILFIANSMATRGNFSFHLQKVIPTAVIPTSKAFGVAGSWRCMVETQNPASLPYREHSR